MTVSAAGEGESLTLSPIPVSGPPHLLSTARPCWCMVNNSAVFSFAASIPIWKTKHLLLLGVVSGVVLALNVPTFVPWLEQMFGFQIMPGDVYYVSDIPSDIELFDVSVIAISAFVLTSLATLYPARRAALVNPSMALRYE